jgi:hypothetical protein
VEVRIDAGFDSDMEDLNLSQLWRFLFAYRKREGLSNEDIVLIKKSFERYLS